MWFCTQCGADSPKWSGKCPACGAWNTMVEEKVASSSPSAAAPLGSRVKAKPRPVNAIEAVDEPRIMMPSQELNRVLGGGLVKGSIVLLGGEPGIGKSTLVLQNLLSFRTKKNPLRQRRRKRHAAQTPCRPHRPRQRQLLHRLRNIARKYILPHRRSTTRHTRRRLHSDHCHRHS